jgi:hypothetical protein
MDFAPVAQAFAQQLVDKAAECEAVEDEGRSPSGLWACVFGDCATWGLFSHRNTMKSQHLAATAVHARMARAVRSGKSPRDTAPRATAHAPHAEQRDWADLWKRSQSSRRSNMTANGLHALLWLFMR